MSTLRKCNLMETDRVSFFKPKCERENKANNKQGIANDHNKPEGNTKHDEELEWQLPLQIYQKCSKECSNKHLGSRTIGIGHLQLNNSCYYWGCCPFTNVIWG